MKLISRKSLVAVACSAAMITGTAVAPAMAADATPTTTPAPGISSDLFAGAKGSSDAAAKTTTQAGDKDPAAGSATNPKEMGEWAKAVAAIISTLTAIWTFVQKFLLKK